MNIKVFCAYRYTGRISTLAKVLRHGQFKFHELTPGEDFIGCFLDMIHRNRSPASRIGTSYLEPTSIFWCRFVLSIGKVDSIISPQYFCETEFIFNYGRLLLEFKIITTQKAKFYFGISNCLLVGL